MAYFRCFLLCLTWLLLLVVIVVRGKGDEAVTVIVIIGLPTND